MSNLTIDEIVKKVNNIDVLPTVVMKIHQVSKDPKSSISDMEEVILKDQVLTSKILKLANSAYYGYARRISTISQATILLGFDTIKSMALASTMNSFLGGRFDGYALDNNELWIQSQTCAIIARHLAKKTKAYSMEEAYIAGLLRDIGKTILNQYMVDEYKKVVDQVLKDKHSFADAERKVFGFNHPELGARIAQKWNLPPALVDAIEFHHSPEESPAEDKRLLALVHLADSMTMIMGVGLGIDGLSYRLSEEALEILDIDDEFFKLLMAESIDLVRDRESFIL